MKKKSILIRSNILNPISDIKCLYMEDCGLVLSPNEKEEYFISKLEPWSQISPIFSENTEIEFIDAQQSLILPGFIDLHFHWVQDDVRQMPKKELLDWLKEYTWPHEAKFKNENFSFNKALQFSKYLAKVGTLGGAVYGSPHEHTVYHAHEHFVGDFTIGNVLMTMNSPEELKKPIEESLKIINKLSTQYQERYALTPRIAPVVDPIVMSQGAQIAKALNSFIQTHLSETKNEIQWVIDLFKKIPQFHDINNYTQIYERCNLLGSKTILGHCIHVNDEELQIIAKHQSHIAHCPSSNAPIEQRGLGSGLFDFRKVEKMKISWGLGSDIGAGPWLSMLDVMNSFVEQNNNIGIAEATYTKALYRATLKSAQILGLDNMVGNLNLGKWANFVLFPLPKMSISSPTGEDILKALIQPYVNERYKLDQIAESVYFRGKKIFTNRT